MSLIEEIIKGKCVLFLGPELLINTDGKYYKSFFKEFAKGKDCIKYFPKDNLFHISSSDQQKRLDEINKIASFYETAGDENILRLVYQLPFPLIINLAPDNAINKIFRDNNRIPVDQIPAGMLSRDLDFVPEYFGSPSKDIQMPTIAKPIIYNIFGSCNESTQTLIIDHKDLFTCIKELMQKDSIPLSIRSTLKQASYFIFLGIEFETWYYQLLLSILDVENAKSVRISTTGDTDNDIVSVMNSHFRIAFEPKPPLIFMQEIYNKIKETAPASLKPIGRTPLASTAFISYAWNDKNQQREEWVDRLSTTLHDEHKVQVLRDKNELTIGDSIKSFMDRIGSGKTVIMVISDKYIKSEFCMYEAWQVYQRGRFTDRTFLVILNDVDTKNWRYYEDYWRNEKKKVEKEMSRCNKTDHSVLDNLSKKYKNFSYIHLFIGDFMGIIRDAIRVDVNETLDNGTDYPFPVIPDNTGTGELRERSFKPNGTQTINNAQFNVFISKILNRLQTEI